MNKKKNPEELVGADVERTKEISNFENVTPIDLARQKEERREQVERYGKDGEKLEIRGLEIHARNPKIEPREVRDPQAEEKED